MAVAAVLVDEDDDAGCRLSQVPAMMLEVLAPCVHRRKMNSPRQAETPIRPRPDCVLQLILVFPS